MKKRIKSFVVIILLVLMSLFITGCSVKKIEPQYGLLEEAEYSAKISISFSDILEEEGVVAEKADSEEQENISSIESELVNFINEEYDLDWKTSNVQVYELDFSEVDGYSVYNAMADPENNSFFRNSAVETPNEEQAQIIYVHELIHCLTYKNLGTYKFVLTDSENGELGYYNSEAFTDFLTIKFFESKGMPEAKEFLYSNSGYCYTTCALIMLEEAIPNEIYYFLTNDIESFEKDFNKLASEYMDIPDGLEENAFETFLYRTDLNQAATLALARGEYSQNIINIWFQTIFGNFEEVVIISRGLSTETQNEIYDECYNLFASEGEITDELDEFLEYLNSCIR